MRSTTTWAMTAAKMTVTAGLATALATSANVFLFIFILTLILSRQGRGDLAPIKSGNYS
jgi:hypothetical protein